MSQGASSVDEEYERRPVKFSISLINLFLFLDKNKLTKQLYKKNKN